MIIQRNPITPIIEEVKTTKRNMKKQYTAPVIEEQELEMETIIALSDGDEITPGTDEEEVEQMSNERKSFGLW